MRSFLMSGYALSTAYRQHLESKLATRLEPIPLAELRRGGLGGMYRALRRLEGASLYVAYEDPSSIAALPMLRIAASLTRTRSQYVVDDQLRLVPISRFAAIGEALGLLRGSVTGLWRCALATVHGRILMSTARSPYKVKGSRILYLNANLWFGVKAGGSVGHTSGVVNAFENEGFRVLFASAGGRLMVRREVAYQPLNPPQRFGMPWEINNYTFDDLVVSQLEPLARQFAPAFIYQRMSLGNTSGLRLARRLKVPLVLEYNGSEVWVARNWGRPLRLPYAAMQAEEVNLRHAQLIVTVSDALQEELRERGVEPSRIATYPNCFDPSIFDPARFSTAELVSLRNRYGVDSNATVVTFIGSFGEWHGVPVLAQVIRRFIDTEANWLKRHKVTFMLIGDGIKMSEVRSVLAHRTEGSHVRLLGLIPQDAAPLHLAASDILCSPHVPNVDGSRFFGSPTKLFEYMAMGKGIVASDLDQIGSVLRSSLRPAQLPAVSQAAQGDYLAVLCRPGDADELAMGIRFLTEKPDWRRWLGENARREALRHYTWSTHVRHILACLQKTLDR